MSKRECVIYDVDGTLCDVSGIRHHVDPSSPRFSGRKRFDLFHSEAIDCPPHPQALAHLRELESEFATVIVTARKGMWRYHTILWLIENRIDYDDLFMRDDEDNRKDFAVKFDILGEIRRRYEPVLAVDDNPAVIRLWEQQGIPTIQIPGWRT
jgi:hypothetical protein